MEMRIISMTDRNNELIRKYFGEDCLLELQRQHGDADIIAVNVPDMRIAASSQPCKEGVQDDRDRDRDSLVPDLLKFGKLELKSVMAAVSDKSGHVLETLDTSCQHMIYTRDELSCGHKESLTEMGVIFEGRMPTDGMQQCTVTSYQLCHGYNGSLTEMGLGGRFEGRLPNDGMSVQQWQTFDGGGLEI